MLSLHVLVQAPRLREVALQGRHLRLASLELLHYIMVYYYIYTY